MNDTERQASTERYLWAAEVARLAMGKSSKIRGSAQTDKATEDPLAHWCLTELIATGGPK
jgi:hypothetical protein